MRENDAAAVDAEMVIHNTIKHGMKQAHRLSGKVRHLGDRKRSLLFLTEPLPEPAHTPTLILN